MAEVQGSLQEVKPYTMGRTPKYLPTVEDSKVLTMAFLKKHRYLNDGVVKDGQVSWILNGNVISSINIAVNMRCNAPYLTISCYSTACTGQQQLVQYNVYFDAVKSNLGKGIRYYFICPQIGKRCINLYRPWGNYFLHREAFKGFYYEMQVLPKSVQPLLFMLYERKEAELIQKRLSQGKRINSHYKGKPTRYQQRIAKLHKKMN